MKIKVYTVKDLDTGFIYNYSDRKKLDQDLCKFPNHTITENYENVSYYIEISLLNNKNQEFEKGFDSLKEAKLFLNKLVRGNSLKVTSIRSLSSAALKELDYVFNYQTKNC